MISRKIFLFLFVASLLGAPASSAEGADNEDVLFFAQEAEIVHAATKHAQSTSWAPASAYVISAAEIEQYGYRTLAEALQQVPGFYISDDRNYNYVGVRGFGRPGDYNTRVLLLINGHRINENVYGAAYVANELPVDIKSIQQIEVIKGPGSALYGDSAFFAVINVLTKTPAETAPVETAIEYGSYQTGKAFVSASGVSQEKNGWYASGSYRSMGGQDLFYKEYASINEGIATNSDRERSYNAYTRYMGSLFSFQGASGQRTKRVPTGAFDARFNDSHTETTDSRDFIETQVEKDWTDFIHWTARLYYDWYEYDARYAQEDPPQTPAVLNRDYAKANWYGEENRLLLTPWGKPNTLILGQEFEKNLKTHQKNFNEDPYELLLDNDQRLSRWAFFLQQEYAPFTQLQFTLGLRLDHYESFGNTLNPRLALVYRPLESSVFKLMYGSAFRSPSAFEMFYNVIGNKSNPLLRPEKIRSSELVWLQEFGRPNSLSVSLYHNTISDLISQVTDPDDGLIQYQNKEKVISQGLEITAKSAFSRNLSGRLGYLVQKSYESGLGTLTNSPAQIGTVGLRGSIHERISVAADMVVVSPTRTLQNTMLPAYATVNLITSLKLTKQARVYAGVYNVLDARYSVSGAEEHRQDALEQNGRNFTLGLEVAFGAPRR
ncbi:MAG: TonB-dependent receptor [Elusimicrobiota bacterium]|jgi:iron complex outermembrane receptor protein